MEGDKSETTFHDKYGDAVSLVTPNFWDNIQIVRTYILKHDIPNPVNLIKKYLDFETLHCCFRHASNEIICYIFNNVEDINKICFPTQKCIYFSCTLRKMY